MLPRELPRSSPHRLLLGFNCCAFLPVFHLADESGIEDRDREWYVLNGYFLKVGGKARLYPSCLNYSIETARNIFVINHQKETVGMSQGAYSEVLAVQA